MTALADRFVATFGALASIGRTPTGYRRPAWSEADLQARRWFLGRADDLGLAVVPDGNGNLIAWWGDPDASEVVLTGSHLDSVTDGGAFDGALGVVAAFLAVEELARLHGEPRRSIGVVAFVEEEGARFGVPTIGSRLMTGALAPDQVRGLTDASGIRWAEAMRAAGADPEAMGPRTGLLGRVQAMVELHIEQGRGLVYEDQPVGIISQMWPHGRWRLDLRGAADHAGAARIEDRRDAALLVADAVLAARRLAVELGSRATVGRIEMAPNTTNVVPDRGTIWLDARAPSDEIVEDLVGRWSEEVDRRAEEAGVAAALTRESYSDGVSFDAGLNGVLSTALDQLGITPTAMPTAAGHDAAILAASVPAAMLHVRNITGVSHSPHEDASVADCVAGIEALTAVIEALAWR